LLLFVPLLFHCSVLLLLFSLSAMPRRPGNRSRHAPLRPLSMVECHLCHGIGHYANVMVLVIMRMIPIVLKDQ
jgi:hypothetical protein